MSERLNAAVRTRPPASIQQSQCEDKNIMSRPLLLRVLHSFLACRPHARAFCVVSVYVAPQLLVPRLTLLQKTKDRYRQHGS